MSNLSKKSPIVDSKATERQALLPKDVKKSNYSSSATNALEIENEVIDARVDDKGSTLVIAFLLMLVFQLGNRLFGRLQTYPMHNYPIFMNLLSVFIYIPISFLYIVPMIMFGNQITIEQRKIPQYKFAVMGMWDSLAGIMQTFSVNYITNASTMVLVQQSAIPISMIISSITLNARYTKSQYAGASIVMCGIIAVLLPTFLRSSSTTSSTSDSQHNGNAELFWIFVLVLSCVPMCLSSVYKEKALGEVEIDVVYLNGCVAFFQFLFAIPICVPSASFINIPPSQIFPNIYNGMKCWMGHNTYETDDCSSAPFFVTTYLVFNIVYNILTVVVLKHGSANILFMASTVIVPLSNVAFSLNIMPNHKPMTYFDVLGLIVIMTGLTVYRFSPQIYSYLTRLSGKTESTEELEEQRKVRLVSIKAEGKQTKYVGLNQIEGIQSLFDSRVGKEQKQALYRTPQQIRGSLFVKLGIPPSPLIAVGPPQKNGGPSPSLRLISPRAININPLNSIKINEKKMPTRANSNPKSTV